MPRIDFRAVRALCSLECVLQLIDAPPYQQRGNRGRGPCPVFCGGEQRACSYDFARNLWHCFRCEEGGNALDLFCLAHDLSCAQGARWLCKQLGAPLPLLAAPPPKKTC